MTFKHNAGGIRLIHETLEAAGYEAVPASHLANLPCPPPPAGDEADALTDAVAECLADAGIVAPPDVFAAINRAIDASVHRRGGDMLAEFLRIIDGTAVAEAVRRLLLMDEMPLRDSGKAAGVSHAAISKAEARIRQNLDQERRLRGGWLTGFATREKG